MKLAACFESSNVHFTGCAAKVSALTNSMLCEMLITGRNGASVSIPHNLTGCRQRWPRP